MFSMVRSRLCYANVAATFALVFAMSGGALAAGHYLLTSTSQISPRVLKTLKGKSGQPGAVGAQGAQGGQGALGPRGETGPAGSPGAQGPQGAAGAAGKEGSPWTAGGTLPAGKSETGVWGVAASGTEGSEFAFVPLASFAIPLASPPAVHYIGIEEGQGEPKENARVKEENEERKHRGESELPLPIPTVCRGTVQAPEAAPGNLCAFVASDRNVGLLSLAAHNLISTAGVVITVEEMNLGEEFSIKGTWAVTAAK
jgi:Collagen triple helix repeat (20 copies)